MVDGSKDMDAAILTDDNLSCRIPQRFGENVLPIYAQCFFREVAVAHGNVLYWSSAIKRFTSMQRFTLSHNWDARKKKKRDDATIL